uniref:Uncharacterized protein n=1 Tax=Arundo donax TaxID=35708 RepID=A0A0A8YCJ0_ARUDO
MRQAGLKSRPSVLSIFTNRMAVGRLLYLFNKSSGGGEEACDLRDALVQGRGARLRYGEHHRLGARGCCVENGCCKAIDFNLLQILLLFALCSTSLDRKGLAMGGEQRLRE